MLTTMLTSIKLNIKLFTSMMLNVNQLMNPMSG
jgi:hypothetical protein